MRVVKDEGDDNLIGLVLTHRELLIVWHALTNSSAGPYYVTVDERHTLMNEVSEALKR